MIRTLPLHPFRTDGRAKITLLFAVLRILKARWVAVLKSSTSAQSPESVCLDIILKLAELSSVGAGVVLRMSKRNRVSKWRCH